MTTGLTEEQVAQFRREGWAAPFRAIGCDEVSKAILWIELYEKTHGVDVNEYLKIKGHLAALWIVDLACNRRILDAVESLIGPNILLFGSSIFAKAGYDKKFVSWHQDSAYFGLCPQEEVTAWVALTESNSQNGALQIIPRSHLGHNLQHIETFEENNLLARGQKLEIEDEGNAVTIELGPGEFSLHHERTVHGSKANETPYRRIGFAFFYIPTHVTSMIGRRTALLVRGQDKFKNWDTELLPRYDFDPVAFEAMREAWSAYKNID